MAADDTLIRVTVDVQDEVGTILSTSAFLSADSTKTLANLQTDGTAFANAIQGASGGKVVKAWARVPVTFTAASEYVAQARVDDVGVLQENVAGSIYTTSVSIPAILNDCITNGKPDFATDKLDAVQDVLEDAGAAGSWSNAFGNHIASARDSFLGTRKRRRSLHSRSLNTNASAEPA